MDQILLKRPEESIRYIEVKGRLAALISGCLQHQTRATADFGAMPTRVEMLTMNRNGDWQGLVWLMRSQKSNKDGSAHPTLMVR